MSLLKLYLLLYLIPTIQTTGVICLILLIIICFSWLIIIITEEECYKCQEKTYNKFFYIIISILLTISVVSIFFPDKDTIMQIYGIHYVSNLSEINNVPTNALKLLNKEITEKLEEKK